jgi:hypothetical protein
MWRPLEWMATGWGSSSCRGPGELPLPAPGQLAPASMPPPVLAPAEDLPVAIRQRLVVRVVAGPLGDLGAVRMLREALAGIDGVESISLSGISHHHVQFEGWFGHERELVAALERALPFAFEVESAAGAELGLRLRAG